MAGQYRVTLVSDTEHIKRTRQLVAEAAELQKKLKAKIAELDAALEGHKKRSAASNRKNRERP